MLLHYPRKSSFILLIGILLFSSCKNNKSLSNNEINKVDDQKQVVSQAVSKTIEGYLLEEEKRIINIFNQVSPSVVFIKNAALAMDWFSNYVYEIPQGAGSGFIWDKEGHIVTNFHVIYRANKIEAILSDKKTYEVEVVGVAPEYDLAVLKIKAEKEILKPIIPGISKDLQVGQKILAIGNPFGLDYSLSVGVVSALGRTMQSFNGRKIHDVIQTDAAINTGNSGGPLLNSSGKLIGVSVAIISPSGAYSGVSFGIPVDIVKRVVPQLIKYGKIKKVGLGITLAPDTISRKLDINGVLIVSL